MSVQNLRLLVGLPPTIMRDNFPMAQGWLPFRSGLHRLDQKTLADYVVARRPSGGSDPFERWGSRPPAYRDTSKY